MKIKGVENKNCTFENHSDETVSPAKNMLEGWKGGNHSSVWSTKTFLYFFREPKYKQNNMGYYFLRI